MRRPFHVLVATAMTFGALVAAVPAAAGPAPTAPPGPTADRLKSAVAAAGDVVLIVHTVGATGGVRAAVTSTDEAVRVRHDLGALHEFSLQVRSSDAAAEITRLRATPGVTGIERSVLREFTSVPNDPDLPKQESYLDAVKAPAAWQVQQASTPAVDIAIVDSGVDVSHPDLQGKIIKTYDAANPNVPAITDQVGHGTFVAGVAAAQTNNGVGVAGAGYDAKIMGVKIAAPDGSIEIDSEVAGIKWAADNGADIINLSLGGPDYSQAERDAIGYAQQKGVLVVAAAGNDGVATKEYPAAYPGVVAVGAVDTTVHPAHRAAFSNYGSWVTLAAPGVGIYSTIPKDSDLFGKTKTGYAAGDGTSFSTPIVAGEAALLKAQNPGLDAARIRAELIASSHARSNGQLGAGLVDFDLALKHVAPASEPTTLVPAGAKDVIHVVAASTAPTVRFRINSSAYSAPVPVVNGEAGIDLPTWGYPDGPATLSAVDCTAYGECNTEVQTAALSLTNDAPVVTKPESGPDPLTGRFFVDADHPGGGALQLLIDGQVRGFAAKAPYEFSYSASLLTDTPHDIAVQLCSVDGTLCDGPKSEPVAVNTQALRPRITSLAPSAISPNHDGSKDSGTLRFTLPDTETVRVDVLNSDGTLVRSKYLGPLGPGAHAWTWLGHRSDGSRLPDGSYTLALDTSSGPVHGWVTHAGLVDTVAPSLATPTGANALFYPYRDGYRDNFTTRTTLGGAGLLTLTVRTAHGYYVRSPHAEKAKGSATLLWTGFNRFGHLVRAGTYVWHLTVTDEAGNHRVSRNYLVLVSRKRLVHQTVSVTKHGNRYDSAGGTDICAHASVHDSSYSGGLRLTNNCSASGFDVAFADYNFTVPHAIRYTAVSVQAYGRSQHVPSQLTVAFQRTDGGLEVARDQKISSRQPHWYTIATVPASGHVTTARQVHLNLLLDSYYLGLNDFDVDYARLRVGVIVLR